MARGPVRVPAADFAAPAFAPFARWRHLLGDELPDLARLNDCARERGLALPDGRALRFVPAATRLSAIDYERQIAERGEVATRDGDLHDVCNALAWLAFPRTKAALNARHVASGAAATANRRDAVRDGATLLDESGLLVVCADASIVQGLRDHRWHATFGERRDDVARTVRAFAIGHGLLVKLLAPFPALTAKALVVPRDGAAPAGSDAERDTVDAAAAALVAREGFTSAALTPLPVAALPGWPGDDGRTDRFDDVAVFRPRPAGRVPVMASQPISPDGRLK
jgi:hypothetical protein